jgi:hypothetical protein
VRDLATVGLHWPAIAELDGLRPYFRTDKPIHALPATKIIEAYARPMNIERLRLGRQGLAARPGDLQRSAQRSETSPAMARAVSAKWSRRPM